MSLWEEENGIDAMRSMRWIYIHRTWVLNLKLNLKVAALDLRR